MPDPLQLSEIMCARLCHDLSGPIGSLLAAVELAGGAEASGEALAVAADSAVALGHRLRLLRAAWAGEGEGMGVGEVHALVQEFGTARRLELEFTGFDPGAALEPAEARVLLNLLLLAMEGLAGGGRIAVARAGAAEILVAIDGPRAAWPTGLAAYFADEAAAWDALTEPRSLQAPLVALLARRAGLRLSFLIPAATGSGAPPPLLMAPVRAG